MARFVQQVPMRWSDMDALGHVNNTRYLTYLEMGRLALFRQRPEPAPGHSVIARHEIDYKREVVYSDEPLRLEMWIGRVRGASFVIHCEILHGGQVAARAVTTCVAIADGGHPRRLSDGERAFLNEYAHESA